MDLTPSDREAALFAVRDFITRRRLAARPVPAEVLSLFRRLELDSACGTENDTTAEQSEHDYIDTAAAATILGCSRRWVTNISADLDGRRVAGRWVFPRATVIEYAELKGEHNQRAS